MCRRKTLIILPVAFVAFLAVLIPYERRLARESTARFQHELAIDYFQRLKQGETQYPSIISPELMSTVANDTDIVPQLNYMHFDNTDLNAPEFKRIQEFPNIKVISFYDCEGEYTLLGYAANMPSVNKIYFWCARPSEDLLRLLKAIPNLKIVKFNDVEEDDLVVFKRALPQIQFEVGDD